MKCTAPVKGHVQGSLEEKNCPVHGSKRSYKKNIVTRRGIISDDEQRIIDSYHDIVDFDDIKPGSTVFTRYSSLPFAHDVIKMIEDYSAKPANTIKQYDYINSDKWVHDLGDLTIPTYHEDEISIIPFNDRGYFVKGEVNSVKHLGWNDYCFAANKNDLPRIIDNNKQYFKNNHMQQEVIIKPIIDFEKIGSKSNGQPIFNEWRTFVYNQSIVAQGFYWEQLSPDSISNDGLDDTIIEAVELIGSKAGFYSIDAGRKNDGSWVIIELNDGNLAGLGHVDADELWSNIASIDN